MSLTASAVSLTLQAERAAGNAAREKNIWNSSDDDHEKLPWEPVATGPEDSSLPGTATGAGKRPVLRLCRCCSNASDQTFTLRGTVSARSTQSTVLCAAGAPSPLMGVLRGSGAAGSGCWLAQRLLAIGVLALGAGRCDAGEDVAPRDDVIVLAASRSFWYMGIYQLLEENGRKTDGASSAVVPMLSAHDLKQAGPDACVFLPDLRHPTGCEEWVSALERSAVAGAVVADFMDSRGGADVHACLGGWSARSGGGKSRLAVRMNVTLTPLDVAMADPATRLSRSMLVAHVVPRSLLPSSGTRSAVAPHASRVDACRSACSAVAWAVEIEPKCEEACLIHSYPDPHPSLQTPPSPSPSADSSATAAASPKTRVRLGGYPRTEAILHETTQRKQLSWVEVDTDTLVSNTHTLRRLLGKGVRLCGVIKGNAFGHGLVPAARALSQGGADWLAVDSLEEALVLRDAGIMLPVLVLYWSNPWQASILKSPLQGGFVY